jgi:PAS domain S-box-containing protein
MTQRPTADQRIQELESLLEQAERKSDILTNLLKEASAEFNQALDDVSRSEANFRAIIENAPEAIYMFDIDTRRILDCNPYTTQWLGYSRNELVTMGVEDIIAPASQGVDENIRKAMEDGIVRIQERQFRTRYGAIVDAEVTGTVIELHGKTCFVALVRDITERKKIESLQRYKELFKNVTDPVFICHSQGAFLEVNDVACERLQYSHAELLDMFFKDIFPPGAYGMLSRVGRKIRSGEAVQFESEAVTRTGERIPFEFHSRLIEFQRKPAILSVARDLSARKRMEETLIRTERLSAVGEMAAGVAHNFNNLLQMMLGAGEAALRKMDAGEIRKSREALKTLIEACQRGSDIVRRIKDFTLARSESIEAGSVFDLGELVDEAVQLTRPLWSNPVDPNKYTLNFTRPLGALVEGNPSEIYEVLVNTIKNALEAMPDGGRLSIMPIVENGRVSLSISDTGVGIAEENLQRLFQPFFTTKGLKSSGLGLSSSYGIIRKHRGEMTVDSRPGQGATFTISLPRAKAPMASDACALSDDPQPASGRIRFLVVDDEKNILKMLELYFEDSSIDVTTASNAQQGLQAIQNGPFDLVLCDYSMDDMNGLVFCEAARAQARAAGWPEMKCLLYTGLSQTIDPIEMKRRGIDGVVRKPIPCAKLQGIIRQAVAGEACQVSTNGRGGV